MVRPEMEGRGVPQDPQIRLQGRGVKAENGPTPGEPDRCLLDPELARLLDDDAQAVGPSRAARSRTGGHRNPPPRPRREGPRPPSSENTRPLSDENRTPRRLSRSRERPAAGQYRHVAWHVQANR